MCGIGGIARFDGQAIDEGRVRAMLAHLRHRGPDGSGVSNDGRCALVHTRLSILDLSGGAQPMELRGEDGAAVLTVTFNGEIYNHRELRRELQSHGHRFRTDHSDTEVLLHGFRQWGIDLCKRLNGMFAFALWDPRFQRLHLARDRAGKKPLYLGAMPGAIVFGSMAATVMRGAGITGVGGIDPAALMDFLHIGYPIGSMLRGVSELPPGHVMTVESDGTRKTRRYWEPPPRGVGALDTSTASPDLRETIRAAVVDRLEADVPLGCFLSGGIDSSVVAALAQEELRRRGAEPLRTFSVAMPAADFDESPLAQEVATHLGTRHTRLTAQPEKSLIDDLRSLIAVAGEPMADSSLLPTHWLSRAAREHVKVALSGDGGDELFGGYDRYRAMAYLQRYGAMLGVIPLTPLRGANPRSKLMRLRRIATAARHRAPARRYHSMIHLFSREQLIALGFDADAINEPPTVRDWPADSDPRAAAMAWDFAHYLPSDLLKKVDRASMAVALEVRCPLLDTRVMEFALALPAERIMPGNRPKVLLRELAATLVPESIARRPKRGFAIPIGRWFRHELREVLRERLLGGTLDVLPLQRRAIETMFSDHVEQRDDHTHRLFALLSLSVWVEWLRQPM